MHEAGSTRNAQLERTEKWRGSKQWAGNYYSAIPRTIWSENIEFQKGLQAQRICHRKLEPVKHGHVVLVKHSPEGVYQQTTRSDKKVSHNHQQHTPKPGNDRLRQQKELHQLFIALVDFGTKWQILQFCRARSLLHHLLVLVQLLQILGTIAMCWSIEGLGTGCSDLQRRFWIQVCWQLKFSLPPRSWKARWPELQPKERSSHHWFTVICMTTMSQSTCGIETNMTLPDITIITWLLKRIEDSTPETLSSSEAFSLWACSQCTASPRTHTCKRGAFLWTHTTDYGNSVISLEFQRITANHSAEGHTFNRGRGTFGNLMVPDYYFTVKEQRPESKRHLESRVIYFIQSNQCSALLHVTCPSAWSTQCVLTRHFTIIRMYVTMCQRSVPHSLIHFWNFGTLCRTSRLQVISTHTTPKWNWISW